MKISIIICTYNRYELLDHCLQSLSNQSASINDFEILIVNNNSTDKTQETADKFARENTNSRVFIEKNQGLSHARNRGYKEAKTDWVLYLDDDALARPNFVERAIWVIQNTDYQCFGGMYLPWYHYGKTYWFKEKYASNRKKYTELSVLKKGEYISGGVMAFHKTILHQQGGFSTELGMTGDKIAYGEETELQLRLREKGIQIAYDPDLIIEHIVAKQKLNLDWFFKSHFALGRDQIEMGLSKTSTFSLIKEGVILMAQIFLYLLRFTPKLIQKDYFIQNWLIDVFRKPAKRIGVIYTALLLNSTKKRSEK